jgi:hypothetical protein
MGARFALDEVAKLNSLGTVTFFFFYIIRIIIMNRMVIISEDCNGQQLTAGTGSLLRPLEPPAVCSIFPEIFLPKRSSKQRLSFGRLCRTEQNDELGSTECLIKR